MKNQKPNQPVAGPGAPSKPPTPAKAEKEIDQTVRHAAGQPLGQKETLSNPELERLHGKAQDPAKP